MERSFLELRCKEVVNVTDGKKLGHIIDIVFDLPTGRIKGLVVPVQDGGFSLFKKAKNIFIPYHQICKIGNDIILVELYGENIYATTFSLNEPQNTKK